MLDADTRRRIDTARDILVGKVPDPKSQVEQITIALIYKFMDDMDAESEELGGVRKFFAGDFARYGWPRLVHSGLGGHETLNLYAEAIARMPENPGVPALFRDIFKNAYLPYRDPETLRAFLKVIDEFSYDHSERLGDAFEYLLSVLGSQGDAGQFRTPRHIIDFIVEIVDPKKDETVLDPACGTAGFLISSYKHILAANTDARGHVTLTPDERGRLARAFTGYDISPDMVRLSLVNMYLHGFADPHIAEYDTLTSLERWNEYADVILANPPFMSPKGGIRPHNRFSVQSKRSEVLFVDYMAEHLTPNGRAGIIVPEGIIFQSQTAYKALRKMLVETCLVAVVSLPSGVFNPYSGVKTSILILDRDLARQTEALAFFKVEADGFDLGAQRRPIDHNDLPQVAVEIAEYLRRLRAREPLEGFAPKTGLIVPKAKLAANGEYNLSGERYRESGVRISSFVTAPLGELCDLIGGSTPSKQNESYWTDGSVKWISSKHIDDQGRITASELISRAALEETSTRVAPKGSTIIITRVSVGKYAFADDDYAINQDLTALVPRDNKRLAPTFLHVAARHIAQVVERSAQGTGVRGVTRSFLSQLDIPLPPLSVQQEIVVEIEGYQKVIDGARAVLDAYRPHIPIDPAWPMVAMKEVCAFRRGPFGGSLRKELFVHEGFAVYEQRHAISGDFSGFRYFIDEARFGEMKGFEARPGDLIMSCSGTMGRVALIPDGAPPGIINQALLRLTATDRILVAFLKLWMDSADYQQAVDGGAGGAAIRNVASVGVLKDLRIPLPPLDTQQAIVAELEAEQRLVDANRELVTRMEKKIEAVLARVWGEGE